MELSLGYGMKYVTEFILLGQATEIRSRVISRLVCAILPTWRNARLKPYMRDITHLYPIGIDHDTVCAGVDGTAIRNSTSCAGRRAAAPAGTISILPRSQFTKSKGNLRFRRLVPLFVPIGVCVTTHGDGTASDVTIGMWRHNQQVTNHERHGKPWLYKLRSVQNTGTCYPGQGWFVRNLGWGR